MFGGKPLAIALSIYYVALSTVVIMLGHHDMLPPSIIMDPTIEVTCRILYGFSLVISFLEACLPLGSLAPQPAFRRKGSMCAALLALAVS
jgi:hypothetical protein